MHKEQGGFTFVLVIFVIALTGAGLATFGEVWSTTARREREAELLFAGDAIRQAIGQYHEATPGPVKHYPNALADLLLDSRFPEPRRYLRRIYRDPITGSSEWALIRAPQGGVMGVASFSEETPLKIAGFRGLDRVFEALAAQREKQLRYRDWEFIYQPVQQSLPVGRR